MVGVSIQSNIDRVTKEMGKASRQVVVPSTNAALNKTGSTIVKTLRRDVAKDTGLKAKVISERLRVKKSTFNTLEFGVRVFGKWFNLARFGAKQTKVGVSHKAWGRRQVSDGAFIANNGRTVFARKGKERLPIKALPGPNPAIEFGKELDKETTQAFIFRRFDEVFRKEMTFRFNKLLARAK